MPEPIPVTFRHDHTWRTELSFEQICNVLIALTEPDKTEVKEGAIEPLRLDAKARREDDNALKLAKEVDRRVNQAYRFNKGLAMELATAAVLTRLDHPAEVLGNCTVSERGLPNNCAPSGLADIVVRPAGGQPPFRIVCEVTAWYHFRVATLNRQLSGTVAHAEALNKEDPVPVTYGLLINCGTIGERKDLQRFFRNFVAGKQGIWWKKVEEKAKSEGKKARKKAKKKVKKGLDSDGPIRLVSMYTGEFVTLIRRLESKGTLSFDSQSFAKALDVLHERLRGNIPKKKKGDWMVKSVIKTIEAEPEAEAESEPEPQLDMFHTGSSGGTS